METVMFPGLDICWISKNRNRCCNLLNPVRQRQKGKAFNLVAMAMAKNSVRAFNGGAFGFYEKKKMKKDSICTADELHYASLPNSNWKLALWRYLPSLRAQSRNHPLLLLSGIGSNALGFDLSPESSFARNMSQQGYDTWILEVRGSGLSTDRAETSENEQPFSGRSEKIDYDTMAQKVGHYPLGKQPSIKTDTLPSSECSNISPDKRKGRSAEHSKHSSERIEAFSNDGESSAVATQLRHWNQSLIDIIERAQQLGPFQPFNLQGVTSALEDFQEQLDLIDKYDWDFDHYLEEDVPAAMEYIRGQCRPKDGKLLAIGHSMGGILLYAMISRCCFNKVDPQLASIVTLGSSLDYRPSNSSLRFLLPLVDPVQALNVPVFPIGPLIVVAHPLATRPPYVLSWLSGQISAEDMMHPSLLEKLVMNGFETVPAKVLLQLSTVFQEGGLCDRTGTFLYKDHLHQSNVPILAVAGDKDLICPPEAVYETVKLIPRQFVSYKVLGKPGGPHYAHYDIVGSRLAATQVYSQVIDFLNRHDMG